MAWTDAADNYAGLFALLESGGTPDDAATWLNNFWSSRATHEDLLKTFVHGEAEYLFELPAREAQSEPRTLGTYGFAERPQNPRETSYQARFPLTYREGRPADRGHLMPYSAAGLYGPNFYRQDRALNSGRSADGRQYRALEDRAVKFGGLYFCALLYCDDSDYPAVVETGVIVKGELEVRAFRNRFDPSAITAFPYSSDPSIRARQQLGEMTSAQIGDLGEEVVRLIFDADESVEIIAMGDSRMDRDEARQDLDAVVLIDDALVAVEVKARHQSGLAGTLTRSGNLRRPRLGRGRRSAGNERGLTQASAGYNLARATQFLERPDGELDARVYLVDLRAWLVQWFPVNATGRLGAPLEPPRDCTEEVLLALAGFSEQTTAAEG